MNILVIHIVFISIIAIMAVLWYGTRFKGWGKNNYKKYGEFFNLSSGPEDFEERRTGFPKVGLIISIGAYVIFLSTYGLIVLLT
ncbi:MAG: hypothetical protein HN929_02760 [Chloroflexi bacterium]|jgi:hypothetical protein|nr:hypothetical protein [Chloroflexota bacterium]MBT7080381.1 hypothetical protein [Chloroflexota bacterium]MBT7289449.1 hypothetical protein [Chloroflexota bacterium]